MSADSPEQGRMARKKEKMRAKIVDTAFSLFAEHGFNDTTMEQIAEEADIAKGTLYNYFPAKEAIVGAYIQRNFAAQREARLEQLTHLPDTRARLEFVFTSLLEGVQRQSEIFEKFLVYRMQNMVSFQQDEAEASGMQVLAVHIVEMGQQAGEIRIDIPQGMLLDLFEFVFISAVKQFYLQPDTLALKTTIEMCIDLFLAGVQVRPA